MKRNVLTKILACLMAISLVGCQAAPSSETAGGDTKETTANETKNDEGSEAATNAVADEESTSTDAVTDAVTEADKGGEETDTPVSYNVEEKTLPAYITSADNKKDLKLYFVNGGVIPYISAGDIADLLQMIYESESPADPFYKLEYSTDGDHAVYSRGPYKLDFDFTNDTISFNDFDAFFKMESGLLVDMVPLTTNTAKLFQQSNLSTDRYGEAVTFDLKPYSIDLVSDKDGYYVPLQTVSDVIFSFYGAMALYNGNCVIIAGALDEELKALYQDGSGEWTKELAEFSYNETCFVLDYEYGLKEIHDISSFDRLLSDTGLKAEFLSEDPVVAEAALYKLIYLYLGDLHSQFTGLSYKADRDKFLEIIDPVGTGLAGTARTDTGADLQAARDSYYPDGIPAYEEVGNTAYITFDAFVDRSADIDYFAKPTEADNSGTDTIRLMQYACQQILREGSPIENVVMDLSLNGGGDTGTAEYVMATFLGQADLSTKNTLSGAMTDAVFTIDTNLDGKFDEKDTLAGKGLQLYCLESPFSFSCGNLVPSAFKASHKVTLLGQESGGGSCAIHPLCTAGGSQYQVSGYRRFSVMKNGSFYDVDRGAQPDYFIGNTMKFYDRKGLTGYINRLY
ncbi:MAG: hypothetical protein K5989_04690 [Lachnospiraceae bacterium]|nr:hypothetical protein [Lachnospiraceae bacterium]